MWTACILTLVIETAFFVLLGLRKRDDLILVAAVNVATNLALNLFIAQVFRGGAGAWIYSMELCVVIAEYAFYSRAWGRSRPLFLKVIAANVLSYGSGLLIARLVLY